MTVYQTSCACLTSRSFAPLASWERPGRYVWRGVWQQHRCSARSAEKQEKSAAKTPRACEHRGAAAKLHRAWGQLTAVPTAESCSTAEQHSVCCR